MEIESSMDASERNESVEDVVLESEKVTGNMRSALCPVIFAFFVGVGLSLSVGAFGANAPTGNATAPCPSPQVDTSRIGLKFIQYNIDEGGGVRPDGTYADRYQKIIEWIGRQNADVVGF